MQIKLLPQAIEDIDNSIDYYENIDIGLSNKFLKELDVVFEKIKKFSDMYPYETKTSQKLVMQTFPYIILYEKYQDIIMILAVFHTSQDPKKLKKRLS